MTPELIAALGSSAAAVIVVKLFLNSMKCRDAMFIAASKQRDDRMALVLERCSQALEKSAESSGQMAEAIRRVNGH